MARTCGWCSTTPARRGEWERRVLDGETLDSVASSTPFSSSAAARHMTSHARRAQLAAMASTEAAALHVADFGDRLLHLADESAALRRSTTDVRAQLLGVREERRTIVALLSRLGISDTEVLDALGEARALAEAVTSVLSDEPRVADALARRLGQRGDAALAAAFHRLAEAAEARQPQHQRTELAG